MKIYRFFILLIFFLFIFQNKGFSQEKLIIQSKENIKNLLLKDLKSGKIKKIPTWQKTGGGFLLKCKNIEKTLILSSEKTSFKIFKIKDKVSSKWIDLEKKDSILISQCFDNKVTNTNRESEGIIKETEKFISSIADGYSVSGGNTIMRTFPNACFFSKEKYNFIKKEDVFINWEKRGKIKNIFIRDLNSLDIVWLSANYNDTILSFSKIKNKIFQPLKKNTIYELKINLIKQDSTEQKYVCKFEIAPFIFNQKTPNVFVSPDSFFVSWNCLEKKFLIDIENKKTSEIIVKDFPVKRKYLDFKFLKENITSNFQSKTKYKLTIKPKRQTKKFDFNFEFFLNLKEYEELKKFVENE